MSQSTTFVRLFVGFLLIETGVHASCPIELSPPRVVVRHGDPVSINCSTSESQFDGIGWEATEGGMGLQQVNHLTWTVKRLTNWNISPSCFFNPSADSPLQQCSKSPEVIVYSFPETISISSNSSSNGVMKEMQHYNLQCVIHNVAPARFLTLTWYREGAVYRSQTFSSSSKEPDTHSIGILLEANRHEDGVTFKCEAHLNLTEGPLLVSVQEYNVTVYYGPHVECSSPELPEGETLRKHCPVTGNPTPIVKWLKDGQPTDPAAPLSREDAGLYTVKAEGFSSIEKELRLNVSYGPELMCPSDYTVPEFTPPNFTCTAEGYPKPEMTWYKNGKEVKLPENLTRSDAGQYLITASNKLSSVNLTVEFIVTYPPSQIAELRDSEVDVGSTVWLKCSSTGNPRPKYFWEYYRLANVVEEHDDGVSQLIIHNATAYNMGFYTCHAWNERGNVSKTARVTVHGAKPECPIEIEPDRMVIQYQSSGQNATCEPTFTGSSDKEGEIYWQVQQGTKTDSTSWFVDTHKDWDPRPVCTATFQGIGTCQKHLDFTLYKSPDSVSIRLVDNLSLVVEEREFQLQCDITNVAPARNLAVRWYQGNETFEPRIRGSVRAPGCLHENNTDCDINVMRFPLNVSSTVNVTLHRQHNGAEFQCEAVLDLGAEGPQPPPSMMSSPLNIIVYYKPIINTTKLPKKVPVFRGYPEDLVCEADGHPPPRIQWFYSSNKVPHVSGDTLIVSEAGIYNCSASNEVDSIYHEVEVILKEDYLPLIAGFVAVTVVAISIIFLFIYSIYYKNTRMRRYSLKNPKLNTHNGNVAHNGWDLQLPMTKLS